MESEMDDIEMAKELGLEDEAEVIPQIDIPELVRERFNAYKTAFAKVKDQKGTPAYELVRVPTLTILGLKKRIDAGQPVALHEIPPHPDNVLKATPTPQVKPTPTQTTQTAPAKKQPVHTPQPKPATTKVAPKIEPTKEPITNHIEEDDSESEQHRPNPMTVISR